MTREEAIRIFRKEIECLSHAKCEDCILEKVCDPAKTTPLDSEYIEAYGMAIQALSQKPICPSAGVDCEDCPAYEPCEVEATKLQQAYNKGFDDCRQAVLDLINADWEYEGLEVPVNSLLPVTQNPETV